MDRMSTVTDSESVERLAYPGEEDHRCYPTVAASQRARKRSTIMTMSKSKNKPRKFPKILADEVRNALRGVRDLTPERIDEYLARFRRDLARLRRLRPATGPTPGADNLLIEWVHKIAALHTAFEKLHAYNRGEVDDYISAAVVKRVISEEHSRRASGPRDMEGHGVLVSVEEIAAYLTKRNYLSATRGQKADLVSAAVERFAVNERKVRRAISQLRRQR